jgi:hypothetical protein
MVMQLRSEEVAPIAAGNASPAMEDLKFNL